MNKETLKRHVLYKINKGLKLTLEEELFYMIEILGFSEHEANRIIAINQLSGPDVIID